jgi:hypothetical protein
MEELAQTPTSWARIGLYAGIAGLTGGTIGAMVGKNKIMSGLLGFVILGGIGAFIGYESSKGANIINA